MKRSSFVMQSVLALRALAVIIVMLTAATARADDSGYCGDPSVHSGQDVRWSYNSTSQTFTITGTGAMENYNLPPWFLNSTFIKTVIIGNGVTSIGSMAFSLCTSLTSVTIPSSVTSIGKGAFLQCSALKSVVIPSSVTSIGESAFYMSGLTSVTIPSSVTSIEPNAFYSCSGLTSVTISSSVTKIGDYAFQNCGKLRSVDIPASVTSIGEMAFYGCTSLTSVLILASELTTYGDDAFDENANGRKIYVPSGSANNYKAGWSSYSNDIVGFDGFCGDPSVNDGKNVAWALTDEDGDVENIKETLTIVGTGAMATYAHNNFPWRNNRENIKTVVIGNGVTSIGDYAFNDCTSLTSINIPSSVTGIGESAFSVCTSLTSVTIPSSVTSIGYFAFFGCLALETITVDEGNPTYDSRGDCNAIIETESKTLITGCKNTAIPDGVTSIADYAFHNCALTSITIPNSVTSIGERAFEGCATLPSVTIPSSMTSIGEGAFGVCKSLTTVTISFGLTSIGEWAFNGCTGLTTVTIPASVTSIGEDAFYGCTNLTEVYCYANPDGLTWNDDGCNDFIYDRDAPAKTTICHVAGSKLATFEKKWNKGSIGIGGTDVNVIFVGDGIATDGYDYVVGTVTYGSGTAPAGVKAFLPVAYDLSTATVTLAEIEGAGAPKGMPVIYGSATEGKAMPDLFFLNYVADNSDDDKAIQSNYDSKANAMSSRFVITKGDKTLTEILSDAGVSASEAIFFVLKGGKFRAVDVSDGDLDYNAKPGLLLFILSKWEYMQVGTKTGGGSANSRGIGIGDGGATGLTPIPSPTGEGSGAWYDMQGRRIDKPARKGVYIRNGKKIVVK